MPTKKCTLHVQPQHYYITMYCIAGYSHVGGRDSMNKLAVSWLFGGVLLCVLLVDLLILNYNQQCSVYVQLDTDDDGGGGGGGGRRLDGPLINGLRLVDLVEAHLKTKTGQGHARESPISQYPDIDVRGEWQRKQVDRFCKKYGEDELSYSLPNNSTSEKQLRYKLLRHLLYDDERQTLLCFIPKVGCTNLKRFFFLNQGVISEKALDYNMTDSWEHQRLEGRFLQPGISKASLLNEDLSNEERLWRINTYFKFTFVRHPLERLLSAYIDKISPPLRFVEPLSSPDIYQRYILIKTRKEELDKWRASNGSYNLAVSFSEYIQWWVGANTKQVDEHYSTMLVNAQPCRVRYHFYGAFKLYSTDMALVVKRLNGSNKHFSREGAHPPGHETRDKMISYYSQLSAELKTSLYERFYKELDFYYSLFPEERDSHKHILGFS